MAHARQHGDGGAPRPSRSRRELRPQPPVQARRGPRGRSDLRRGSADEARGEEYIGAPRYRGNHGHRPDHPDNGAFFLAAGVGVRRADELGAIASRDVAPTVAHLLGVELGDVEGKLVVGALV